MTGTRSAALVVLALGAAVWAAVSPSSAGQGAQAEVRPPAAPDAAAPSSASPKIDRYGDPLPPGAAMRLGTVRFRHDGYIEHIAYSPDGRSVWTCDYRRRIQAWDARDGKKLRQIDLGMDAVRDFAFSPDGKRVAAVGFQYEPGRNLVVHYLTFTDVATGRPVRRGEWDEQDDVWKIAYAPDGRTVATASGGGTLRLWDVAAATVSQRERQGDGSRLYLAFATDGESPLLATAWKGMIQIRDLARRRDVRTILIDGNVRPSGLAFSPDGTTVAAGLQGEKAEVRLWRAGDGTLLGRIMRPGETAYHLSFSPDGKILAATGRAGRLLLIDVATMKERDTLSGVRLAEGPLAFSPDGRTLATTGGEHVLHFWDLATGEDRLATPEAHLGPAAAFAFLDGGKELVSGSDDRTVRIWDLVTGRPLKTLSHDGWVRSAAVSVDGALLATCSTYPEWGKAHLWNLRTGDRLHTWSIDRLKTGVSIRGVTLGGDGSSVIAAMSDGSLRRWDASTGEERPIARPERKREGDPAPLQRAAVNDVDRAVFARDGRSLALFREGALHVVDFATGDLRFKAPPGATAGEFAPDGRSLAIARRGRGKQIKLADGRVRGDSTTAPSTIAWLDAWTGHVRREIEIPESRVVCLAFAPDGRAIAAGTSFHWERGIIRIYRLRDKQEVQTIEAPCPWMQGLAFTPDGRRIVAGLSDTSIVIWDVRPID